MAADAYTRAVSAIDGHPDIVARADRIRAAVDALHHPDVDQSRADLVAAIAADPTPDTLADAGAAWARIDRHHLEVAAARTALGQAAAIVGREIERSIAAGCDEALADLDRQLADLIADIRRSGSASDGHCAAYDNIRSAQLLLLAAGNPSARDQHRQRMVDCGLYDHPERIEGRLRQFLAGTPRHELPAPPAGWWPTPDRPAFLTDLAHRDDLRPCVPARADLQATAARLNELIHAEDVARQPVNAQRRVLT